MEFPLINNEYPFSKDFQAHLLALLVRRPKEYLRICEPRHFGSPVHMDIARLVAESYEKHGTDGFLLSRATLGQIVKKYLGTKRRELWPEYKCEIRKLFKLSLTDKPILHEQLRAFIDKSNYRDALVQAERSVNDGRYDDCDKIFEEVRSARNRNTALGPTSQDFPTPHRLGKVTSNTWLVDRFIPEGGLTLLVGPPESSKSLTCLLWEYSVARQRDFLGLRTRRRMMLHVDAENGLAEIKRRCELFQIKYAPDLLFWPIDDPKHGPPPQFPDPIYQQLAQKGWTLIFDSLAFLTGGKVMKSEDVVPILYELRTLAARTGVAIVVIHHSSDKEVRNQYLGSTFIRAALDAAYFVQTTKNPLNEDRQLVELQSIKSRRGSSPSLAMEVDFSSGTYEKVVSPHEQVKQEPMRILAELIRKRPDSTKERIIAKSGLGRHKARTLLQLGEGKYWKSVPAGNRNQLRYELIQEA